MAVTSLFIPLSPLLLTAGAHLLIPQTIFALLTRVLEVKVLPSSLYIAEEYISSRTMKSHVPKLSRPLFKLILSK